jgi:dihydroorotase
MDLFIKNATIINPGYEAHGQQRDVLIQNGKIQAIAPQINHKNEEVLDVEGLHLSIGWMDFGVQVGDPGFEHREDLQSVTQAAAAGGFTAISCQPNTEPIVQSKTDVKYILHRTIEQAVDCYPLGAATHNCKGQEVTEMIDMQRAGALAFTDGHSAIQHAGVMLRALQYVKTFDGLIINQPLDTSISTEGHMHEGVISTTLGMKGIPSMAESLMVQRDIQLLEYTGSRLHIASLSTAEGVVLVRKAKAKGLNITASVPILNLIFDDSRLDTFDTSLKVLPPLRGQADREALIEGVLDGTIDVISSNHVPVDEEGKKLEFAYASFGAIGLETFYALYQTYLSAHLGMDKFIECVAVNPRKILGIPIPDLSAGAAANLTAFLPDQQWVYQGGYSKSVNSHFLNQSLTGKVVGIQKGKSSVFNSGL